MAFKSLNNRNSRSNNRYSNNDDRYENNRGSRSSSSDGRRSSNNGRSGGYRSSKQQQQSEYVPFLSLFSNEYNGRRSVDIKRYETKNGSIEDVLSLEQFLHICTKLYYGEVTLRGSLWDCDDRYADMSGNVRFTEEGLEEVLEDFEAPAKKKAAAKKPAASKAKAKKPVYQEPEEIDVDEDEVEYEEETEEDTYADDKGEDYECIPF